MRNPRLKTSPKALLRHMAECHLLNINELCGFGVGGGGIQYVGGKTFTYTGSTSPQTISLTDLTGGIASQPAAMDLVVFSTAVSGIQSDVDLITDTSYVEALDAYGNGISFDVNFGVYYKFMPATPDTAIVTGVATPNTYANTFVIQVWRGVNAATPLDVALASATGAGSTTPSPAGNPPAVTPVTPGCVILAHTGFANGSSAPTSLQFPGNMPSCRLSAQVKAGGVAQSAYSGAAAYFGWAAGAFDPDQFTANESSSFAAWYAATLVLRPA